MRTSTVKIVFAFTLMTFGAAYGAPSRFECLVKLGNNISKEAIDSCVKGSSPTTSSIIQPSGINTGAEEAACVELGFKKKSESYANCVLELIDRKESMNASSDPDDSTCRKYGFRPKTTNYSECRQKIDMFRAESSMRQEQYAIQKKQFDDQVASIEKERRRQASIETFRYGMGLLDGQTPSQAYGTSKGYPPAPQPPSSSNQTYVFPNGKIMNCTSSLGVINCF